MAMRLLQYTSKHRDVSELVHNFVFDQETRNWIRTPDRRTDSHLLEELHVCYTTVFDVMHALEQDMGIARRAQAGMAFSPAGQSYFLRFDKNLVHRLLGRYPSSRNMERHLDPDGHITLQVLDAIPNAKVDAVSVTGAQNFALYPIALAADTKLHCAINMQIDEQLQRDSDRRLTLQPRDIFYSQGSGNVLSYFATTENDTNRNTLINLKGQRMGAAAVLQIDKGEQNQIGYNRQPNLSTHSADPVNVLEQLLTLYKNQYSQRQHTVIETQNRGETISNDEIGYMFHLWMRSAKIPAASLAEELHRETNLSLDRVKSYVSNLKKGLFGDRNGSIKEGRIGYKQGRHDRVLRTFTLAGIPKHHPMISEYIGLVKRAFPDLQSTYPYKDNYPGKLE